MHSFHLGGQGLNLSYQAWWQTSLCRSHLVHSLPSLLETLQPLVVPGSLPHCTLICFACLPCIPLFWWCNDAFAWVGGVLQAWVVTPSLWHLEAGGLMRVLRQEQQLQKETDVLKPDRTECRHHHHCVRVPSSYLVSLPTPSEVLPSAQNGPDISVFGYKMQHWAWAPVQHYALNAMGFLLS